MSFILTYCFTIVLLIGTTYTLYLMLAYDWKQNHLFKLLEQSYILENRSEILAFIKRNWLLEHLLEARVPLASAFGEASLKKLTLVKDGDGFVTLLCLIIFPGSLEEARQELKSFDESWWLSHSHLVDGKLNFDFELDCASKHNA